MRCHLFGLLLTLVVAAPMTHAENWSHWRGPNFNGTSQESNLPSNWSRTENVAWSADLPGVAAATPVVWGDRVFISGVDLDREMLKAMCFDRTNGDLLWQYDIPGPISRDNRSNYAAGSPTTDGKIVFFFYGNGPLVCFDLEGSKLWERNIAEDYGDFAFLWTFASSPLLFDGKLYIQVLQRDVPVNGRGREGQKIESYLLAINPMDGKTLWQHTRPSKAVFESRESFASPIPYRYNGTDQILVIGGDAISAHDPETGKELWRWGTWNPTRIPHYRHVPSPVAGDGIILACAPKREPIYAIKAGGSGKLDDRSIAWISKDEPEISADVPTPAFFEGDFFVLSDVRKCLSRVEAATGKVKWSVNTPGRVKYEASPLIAGGNIYIVNFDGDVSIVNPETGDILRTISMDDPQRGENVRASVVAAHGQIFIRTTRKLYCIGADE